MPTPLPDAAEVLRAIEIYIRTAYPKEPPPTVRSRIDMVKACDASELLKCREFVSEPRDGGETRFLLRLGNPLYPHMKLAIEPSPGRDRFLYRADTHDRHICPAPDSKEYSTFCQLMEHNQKLAEAIDAAWEAAGVPTFKAYLREDLARRRAKTLS